MRNYLGAVAGNRELRARLGADLERGGFSHAYILEGQEGCGKHTLATAVIMALACKNRTVSGYSLPCNECEPCRKIREGISPDVMYIKRPEGRATMGVDTVRNLRSDVSVLPNDLDFKVYIIEDADTMTPQAQNALLLTLEEPPPFVLFLLLAKKADALLETIRSRAPILRLQPVSDEEMSAHLLSPERPAIARSAKALAADSPEEFAALLKMANGSIGRALVLLEEKKRAPLLAARALAEQFCALLAEGTRPDALLELLLSLPTARDELNARLDLFALALRDLTLLMHSETAPLVFFTDRERAADLAARFTPARLLATLSATEQAGQALLTNANTRLTLIQYHSRLIS